MVAECANLENWESSNRLSSGERALNEFETLQRKRAIIVPLDPGLSLFEISRQKKKLMVKTRLSGRCSAHKNAWKPRAQ